jgi:hypothetical protein
MRFALPIIYNFFQLVGAKDCAFIHAMGPVQAVVFIGPNFNYYFYPCCMPIISFLFIFKIYNRMLGCMGL